MAFEAKYGYSTEFYRTRVRPFSEVLPWDHIDCGVTKEFLQKETSIQRVIFNVFKDSDLAIYRGLLAQGEAGYK